MAPSPWTVGQQVVVACCGRPDRLDRVERVTPTGRPVVAGVLYTADGSARGARGAWGRPSIRPATGDDLAHEKRLLVWRRIQRITQQAGPPGHLDIEALQVLLLTLAPTGTPS